MHARRIVLTGAAALALVAGGTAAGAAIASGPVDGSGVIHACYDSGGNVKLIDASATCPKGYTALNWSQQGQAGPAGPQGATGDTGPAGPQGDQGLAGPAGTTGQTSATIGGTDSLTVDPSTPPTQVPGLNQTITVPANGLVLISTHGGVATLSPSNSGFSLVRLRVRVDGATISGLDQVVAPANTAGLVPAIQNWALEGTVSLTAGQHTIAVFVNGAGQGDPAQVSDSVGTLQGTLTVTILNT